MRVVFGLSNWRLLVARVFSFTFFLVDFEIGLNSLFTFLIRQGLAVQAIWTLLKQNFEYIVLMVGVDCCGYVVRVEIDYETNNRALNLYPLSIS